MVEVERSPKAHNQKITLPVCKWSEGGELGFLFKSKPFLQETVRKKVIPMQERAWAVHCGNCRGRAAELHCMLQVNCHLNSQNTWGSYVRSLEAEKYMICSKCSHQLWPEQVHPAEDNVCGDHACTFLESASFAHEVHPAH